MIKISELQTITVAGVPIKQIEVLQKEGYNVSQLCRNKIATMYLDILGRREEESYADEKEVE